MKTIDSLTIEIVLIDGRLTAVCRDMGVTVEGAWLSKLLDNLGDAINNQLFDLHESGNLEVTDFVKGAIGPSEFDDTVSGWDDWLRDKRWRAHRDKVQAAFFAAYPKADEGDKNWRHMRLPYHDWESEEWDAFKLRAEMGLIEQGGDHPEWVRYCRLVYASNYCMYAERQAEAYYQGKLDWGLPLLPAKEVKRLFKKHGFDAFKLDSERVTA